MPRHKLIWHLFPSYLLLTLVCLLAVACYAAYSTEQFHKQQVRRELEEKARIVRSQLVPLIDSGDFKSVDPLCKELGKESVTRITVILHGGADDGRVIGDSMEEPARMENHNDRPEIQAAIASAEGVGHAERFSGTLKMNMDYVAIAMKKDGRVVAVVRTAFPLTAVEAAMRDLYSRILLAFLIVVALAALISLIISRRIARPLEDLRRMADTLATGDLRHRTHASNSEEIDALGEAMNTMATQLDERIRTVTEQRNELEAVLFGMVEAVVVVDAKERISRLNRAAARYFGLDPQAAQGKSVQEAIRNSDLQRLVTQTLSGSKPVEAEVELEGEEVMYLQAHGTALTDLQGRNSGAVIVLNDVTRLKKLENIRRDFAANVSHELRTPITSIKGFLETLREGKVTDPREAGRFLDITLHETDRLNSIIEDLLSLSRIEKEYEQQGVRLEQLRVSTVLDSALAARQALAAGKNITVTLECDPALTVTANGALLEQAVINLIDNAVKYSEPGRPITVAAAREGAEVVIRVTDQGCGIDAEHLPRIFERFYRVDKGRSRKLGGTGLGLAIVKHIAQANGGRVSVESAPGKGSTFRIHLPLR